MHIYSGIVFIMSTKVKVGAVLLSASCFIKRPFLLQSQRNWGFCAFVLLCFFFFPFTFHISFSRGVDPLTKTTVLKWFSCLFLIGCRLKFQTDRSRSPIAEAFRKMSHGWINRGNKKMDTRWNVNDSLVLLTFLLRGALSLWLVSLRWGRHAW